MIFLRNNSPIVAICAWTVSVFLLAIPSKITNHNTYEQTIPQTQPSIVDVSNQIIPVVETKASVMPKKVITSPRKTNLQSDIKNYNDNHSTKITSQVNYKSTVAISNPTSTKPIIKLASLSTHRQSKPRLSVPDITTNKTPTTKRYNRNRIHSKGLFNTLELEFNDSHKIKAWSKIMPIIQQDRTAFKNCINSDAYCGGDKLSIWARDLRPLQSLPIRKIIDRVNNRVNQFQYKSDLTIYNKADKWLAPRDFLQNGGDCEDFALMKMASLYALGISEDDMRIVVGVIDDGRAHAVLNVTLNGQNIILDNRYSAILTADVSDFSPKYSMNFKKRWTHIVRQTPTQYAYNTAR